MSTTHLNSARRPARALAAGALALTLLALPGAGAGATTAQAAAAERPCNGWATSAPLGPAANGMSSGAGPAGPVPLSPGFAEENGMCSGGGVDSNHFDR